MTAPRRFIELVCPACGYVQRGVPASAKQVSHGPCPASKGQRVVMVRREAVDA